MRRVAVPAVVVLAILGACSGDDDGPLAPRPATTTTTTPTATSAPPDNGLVDGFYPVISEAPQACAAGSDGIPSRTGDACYILETAESVPTRDMVESAEADLDDSGNWTIALTLTEAGIDRFNELAALCFEGTDAERCPTSQVAIAAAGVVVSAPTIQEPSFERDRIQVSGDFTRDEAEELAEAFAP